MEPDIHNLNYHAYRKSIGVKPNEKLVVFATEEIRLDEQLIADILNKIDKKVIRKHNIRFLAKIRHTESVENYKKHLGNKAIVMRGDIHEALEACEAVITITSTVGLEAMILRKPVIIHSPTGKLPLDCIYKDTDAVIKTTNINQLNKALDSVMNEAEVEEMQPRVKEFVENVAGPQDGKAMDRVIDVIHNMMKMKK